MVMQGQAAAGESGAEGALLWLSGTCLRPLPQGFLAILEVPENPVQVNSQRIQYRLFLLRAKC